MNLARLYHTLRPLRVVQWTDRLTRPLRTAVLRERTLPATWLQDAEPLPQIELPRFLTADFLDPISGDARFLNLAHAFSPDAIDWNFAQYGKLWTYHLTYFGWLERVEDPGLTRLMMLDYCRRAGAESVGAEPYTASRRIQHWIGAILRHSVRDAEILERLYADAWRVAQLPEYHLQANHLLQNGFAVYAAALFFNNEKLYRVAKRILTSELHRQFLADGGHIERSASYTADLCARAIWCLHLERHVQRFDSDTLMARLRLVTGGMLSWLESYAFTDESLASIGDSSPDMMPTLRAVREAAAAVGIHPEAQTLNQSGYRKVRGETWEAVINVGAPSPAYQPGHSHADVLTFCIHANGKPLVVDTGVSTYERSPRRAYERNSEAHNGVVVNGKNSSDVWASFRVGHRANVVMLEESATNIVVTHDGYRQNEIEITRTFDWRAGHVFRVADQLVGTTSADIACYIHFHPDVYITQVDEYTWCADLATISFDGMKAVGSETYQWAAGFNLLRPATRLRCVPFGKSFEVRFLF